MSGSDTIQRLLDQVEELHVHPRNQENLKKRCFLTLHT